MIDSDESNTSVCVVNTLLNIRISQPLTKQKIKKENKKNLQKTLAVQASKTEKQLIVTNLF